MLYVTLSSIHLLLSSSCMCCSDSGGLMHLALDFWTTFFTIILLLFHAYLFMFPAYVRDDLAAVWEFAGTL